MPRHSSLLLASCLLIDLAVMSLLIVLALGRPAMPELSAASWLDGRGAATLAPIIILKLALAGLLFLDRAGRERLSACLTATAWLWLATSKALGLHLVIGPILAVHLLVLLPIDAQTPQMIGKLLAMTAVAGVAVAFAPGSQTLGIRSNERAGQPIKPWRPCLAWPRSAHSGASENGRARRHAAVACGV